MATVEYEVDSRKYTLPASACTPEEGGVIRIGSQAQVRYAHSAPQFAEAYGPDIRYGREGWGFLAFMWGLALLHVLAFGFAWRRSL